MTVARASLAALGIALLALPALTRSAAPASADGGASTRNILLGGAAAAGTLLIVNHNQKVHERYAQDARKQAELEEQRNDLQAAYSAEKRAYEQEVALVGQYKRQVALQHRELVVRERRIASQQAALASLKRRLTVARAAIPHPVAAGRIAATAEPSLGQPTLVSYGWGTL
jgi:hypothetical protein